MVLPTCSHPRGKTAGKSQNTEPVPLPPAPPLHYQNFLKVRRGSCGLGEVTGLWTGAKL